MQNDLYNELSQNFIEYAAAVNTDRSIPDAKSGLKPVARRILWSALESGYISKKPYVKSAKIVGDVMGTYHPHGDTSIYEALVRLSRSWIMRYPLIDWHGNNGNIAGDGAAHMRYTEARLAPLSEEGMLSNIKSHNVDFVPNYDDTTEEPLTLPAIFPNLLCNPNEGIGVAMACHWAPHNLREVAAAINDYIDGKDPMLPGPDFPTGGVVINKDDIPSIMKSGHGSVKIRSQYVVEDNKIVFYEIPYGETLEGIIASIGEAAEKKEIEGIIDIRDESNKKGIRIVVEYEKGLLYQNIVERLFEKTRLQSSFSYNQVGLVGKTPTELSLKDCIKIYLDHNKECLVKELEYKIQKAEKRKEVVEGLLKALLSIDEIIQLIRQSESSAAAKIALMETYDFSEVQAQAILNMKLSSLAKLETVELEKEKAELENDLTNWNMIVNDESKQVKEIQDRLQVIVEKYGDERRTQLEQIEVVKKNSEKPAIIPEDVVVIITHDNTIKRIAKANFKIQHKSGKGVKSKDSVLSTISTNTTDTLLLFSNKGKMYRLLVDKIPSGTNVSGGSSIVNLIKVEPDEEIIAATSLDTGCKEKYIIFFTKNGYAKKTEFQEYASIKKNVGTQAIKFKEGDTLVNVAFIDEEDIFIVTRQGLTVQLKSSSIRTTGRVTIGVKAITLNNGDEVMAGISATDPNAKLAVVSTTGKGKRVNLSEYKTIEKGGKGLLTLKRGENVAGAAIVNENDSLLVIGYPNSICVSASELPIMGRDSNGVTIIQSSNILSVVKI